VCYVLFECFMLFCVLCVTVVPLPPGVNTFAVKISNNNNNSPFVTKTIDYLKKPLQK
jgi:hypothetical protein